MDNFTHQMEPVTKPLSQSTPDAPTSPRRSGRHPLLNMSISRRLALGFQIPILVVLLSLGNIGFQSHQLLDHVSTFDQHLTHAYISLTSAIGTLQQTHTNILGALSDADKSQTTAETFREDRATVE